MAHDVPGKHDGVHWHEPSGLARAGFGQFKKQPTPYDAFMEAEGIPCFRGNGVRTVLDLPLAPWKRTGGRGTYVQLYGTETKWGMYVVEVPARGALNPEKHMYEEVFLVVDGRGTTEVWQEGDTKRHTFEWQKGSMFSIPMNAMHRIVNATSSPALLIAGTTAPNVLNMINSVPGVFDNPFVFRDRFSGADDFFKYKDDIEPDPVRGLAMRRTNFIPDVINCDLPLDNRRSVGWRRVEPFMTNNQFYYWIGQHELGRYSKLHAHTSAAVLICLKGKGYTYSWPERAGETPWKDGHSEDVRKVDYEQFGLVTAAPGGARWYHGHYSVGNEPFRLTAWFGPHNPGRDPGPPGQKHIDYTGMELQEGGTAIPYWFEDPYIRKEYEKILKANGVESRMKDEWFQVPEKYQGWSKKDQLIPTSAAG
jgi:quercetin dioxygenase-like cupin family protein